MNRQPSGARIAGVPAGGQFAPSTNTAPQAPTPGFADLVETQRERRGHRFVPPTKTLALIPPLYGTDGKTIGAAGKILHAHYFSPGTDVYVAELDQVTGEAFVIWKVGGEAELTYASLPELESRRDPGLFERDLYFQPARAAQVIPEVYGGRAAGRLSPEDFQELGDAYEAWREHAALARQDDFDVLSIADHHAASMKLEAYYQGIAARHGLVIHGRADTPFRYTNSTSRGDWTDAELNALQQELRR